MYSGDRDNSLHAHAWSYLDSVDYYGISHNDNNAAANVLQNSTRQACMTFSHAKQLHAKSIVDR